MLLALLWQQERLETSQVTWTIAYRAAIFCKSFKSRSALKDDVVEMALTDLLFLLTSSIKLFPLWSLRDFVCFLIDSAINANWAVRIDWICIETYDH